jgi:adenylate kinase family enzyme
VTKIVVVGSSGSGKTTLARRLAGDLGLPHIELDALHHGPNWTEAPREEFRAAVRDAIAVDGWVVDGNYYGKLDELVLEQADVVVWLDLPLAITLPRLLRRTLRRIRHRVELWNGNRETWRDAFLSRDSLFVWAVTTHRGRRRRYEARLSRYDIVRLRSSREAERWLAGYVEAQAAGGS